MTGVSVADLFPESLPQVPLGDQIAAVERELTMRRRVYPTWVANGRMQLVTAELEITRMVAVLETLRQLDADLRETSGGAHGFAV